MPSSTRETGPKGVYKMSFKPNPVQQISMDDRFNRLSPRTKKIVENSWAKPFSDVIFPAINEKRFAVLYSDNPASRPSGPINFKIGALIIQQLMGQTEDELLESICCDIRYQYALHTTSFEEQPISDRTLGRFRARLAEYERETGENLLRDEMMELASKLESLMGLNVQFKRMDSMMIASNIKWMSRLELLYTVVSNALRLMKRLGLEEHIPKAMAHYLEDDDLNRVIYHSRAEEVGSRIEAVLLDAVHLLSIMDQDEWSGFSEYLLLKRALSEQTTKDSSGKYVLKANEEISPTSMQNPSDPDATFRRKAGKNHKGYVANIVESVGENGESLITHASYQQNTHSDSAFFKEYVSDRPDGSDKETVVTDGSYCGSENTELAKDKNVQLITTALTGKQPAPIFADFVFEENGRSVQVCPALKKPIRSSYYEQTESCRLVFNRSDCEKCSNQKKCGVKFQKETAVVMVSRKKVDRAKYLKALSTEEYKLLTRQRNAVEGVPSVFRRRYRVDTMPVRGFLRSRAFFFLKATAINVKSFLKYGLASRPRGQCAFHLATG